MKKLLLIALLLFAAAPVFAQVEMAGSRQYGRLFDIIYDPVTPGKLYAATLGNHIVVSTDNGQQWQVMYTFPKSESEIKNLKLYNGTSLSFNAFNPYRTQNPTLYILDIRTSTIIKEYEIPVPQEATRSRITNYSIFESNSNFAMVQQSFQVGLSFFAKVYYTSNGGTTWKEVYYNVNYDYIFPANVAISPNNPQKLFIARAGGLDPSDYGGLFISNNGGVTWEEKLSGIDFRTIEFKPSDANTILLGTSIGVTNQNVFRSTDGGVTWGDAVPNWASNVSGYIVTIKYNPQNANNIIVMTEEDIVTTTDGFQTHTIYHHPNGDLNSQDDHTYYYGTNATFNPFNQNQIFISANYYPLFSNNAGATVTRMKVPFFSSWSFTGFVSGSGQSHLYYDVQNGFIHKDMNTLAETPHYVRDLNFKPNARVSFFTDPKLPGRIYIFSASQSSSGFGFSNNHGTTIAASTPMSFQYINAMSSHPGNPNLVWGSFSNNALTSELIQINFNNPASVVKTPIALPVTGRVNAIHIDGTNTAKKLIAIDTKMYRTLDNGVTWQLKSNGLGSLVPSVDRIIGITQNPLNANQLTITTTKGAFTTFNEGTTWLKLGNLPSMTFDLVEHSKTTSGHIAAVTYSSGSNIMGLWYSTNSGANWTQVPSQNIYDTTVNAAAFDFSGGRIAVYLSTNDLGVIKYTMYSNFSGMYSTSAVEEDITNEIKVFPNPSHDFIHLGLTNESLEKAAVFSAAGQKVIEAATHDINISELQNGIYFIEITTRSGKRITKQIIKN